MRPSKTVRQFKEACVLYVRCIAQTPARVRDIQSRVPKARQRAAILAAEDQESTAFLDVMDLAAQLLKRKGPKSSLASNPFLGVPKPHPTGKRMRKG